VRQDTASAVCSSIGRHFRSLAATVTVQKETDLWCYWLQGRSSGRSQSPVRVDLCFSLKTTSSISAANICDSVTTRNDNLLR